MKKIDFFALVIIDHCAIISVDKLPYLFRVSAVMLRVGVIHWTALQTRLTNICRVIDFIVTCDLTSDATMASASTSATATAPTAVSQSKEKKTTKQRTNVHFNRLKSNDINLMKLVPAESTVSVDAPAASLKKMVFRRPKSEDGDRKRNMIRIQENPTSLTPPENRSRYTALESSSSEYSPRRCSQAMAHHIAEAMAMNYRPSPFSLDPRAKNANYDTHSFYCICHECQVSTGTLYWHWLHVANMVIQARYLTKGNDESELSTEANKAGDGYGDAVIPFEMMDGTFGMAACALM